MDSVQDIRNNVLFFGNCKDVQRLYHAMDVLVMPSRYEGLPVVGVEAQANNLPCVLSDRMTKETKYTDNVEFISIDEPSFEWAKRIIQWKGKQRRVTNRSKEYNIMYQADKLMLYYENIIHKAKD